ncbi:uncharacterized protein LOC142575690 isoform X3 [Dermacentor variabilis]
MSVKVVGALVFLSICCHSVAGSFIDASGGCLPSLPCRCPCELGLEYPSRCGICVCPPACPVCNSACYFPPTSGASCPTCAPSSYCYGATGKK